MNEDYDIILEDNNITVEVEDSDMVVELNDFITFWSTIYGKPSDSTALVSYLNSLLSTKQDLIYFIVATEADKDSIATKKTGTVAYVKATKKLYIYNAESTTAEWILVSQDLSAYYTKTETDALLANKQPNLTSANAGTGISITGSGSSVVISNTQTSAEWGSITGDIEDQTDLQNALNAKQDTISDLTTIRSNAERGNTAYGTIQTYGDIVTHNTSEFATSAQGTLADTALQPNDNITELNNDAGYITKSVNDLDNYMLTTDINSALSDKQPNLTSANAGTGISITGSGTNVIISNTQTSAEWGNITGTLSNQTDLQTALDAKQDSLTSANAGDNVTIVTGGGGHSLPAEYHEVQYIQSTREQYIDTGLNSTDGYKILTSITPISGGNWELFCGRQQTVNGGNADYFGFSNNNTFVVSTSTLSYFSTSLILSITYDIEYSSITNSRYCKINNDIAHTASSQTGVISSYNIYLFAICNAGQPNNYSNIRISYFKAYDSSNTLVLDLIPCYRISDDKPGMYDLVSNTFFTNANESATSDFIIGSEVSDTTKINALSGLTASVTELNVLDGITATTTELNYTDGVTSNIQTQINSKLNTSDVINNVTTITTNQALSANMGKELNDRINNISARGRFLSEWDCTTGLAETTPTTLPYEYKTGDYFIVGTVGTTNYQPTGSSYTGEASTVVETNSVAVNDTYLYDGSIWKLLHGADVEVTFASIAGQPTDNSNLASALNGKVTANNAIVGGTYTKITYDSKGLVTAGSNITLSDVTDVTASANELNILDGATITTSELNVLDGITATTAELNYTDGVTSNIQTQLDAKQSTLTSSNAGDNVTITLEGTHNLPSEYQEVEYLSYPDNASIAGYNISLMKFADCDKIEYTFKSSDTSTSDTFLGDNANSSGFLGFSYSLFHLTIGGTDITITTEPATITAAIKGNDTKQTWTISYDNSIISSSLTAFTIGGYNDIRYAKAKNIYEIKCYLDDVVVADYIPCYKKSNNVTGMYDITNNVFHANAGSSQFGIGSDVEPTLAKINALSGLTATVSELNVLDGITATTTELNYSDGVTSNIQTQLDGKQDSLTSANAGDNVTIVEGQGGHDLPAEYQEVEGLSHPGAVTNSQYNIDLMKFADCNKIEVTFKSTDVSGNDIFLGSSYSTSGYWLIASSGTQLNLDGARVINPTTVPATTSAAIKGNGAKQTWSFTYDNSICTKTTVFNLGGYFNANFTKAKTVYEIKCYLDDTVVADYISCYRKSDNKTGMYDITNNVFHASNGSEEFTVGPDLTLVTKINALTGLTATVSELNVLDGITATTSELNYTDGVTSNIQTQLDDKLNISDIINNVVTTTTNQALSANMGKELQDQITHLQGIGRFLSLWNCSTGLAQTNPTTSPYLYKAGDYYIIGTVAAEGSTNYKPSGTQYEVGVASTTAETETVKVGYVYYYDGSGWNLSKTEGGTVSDVQVNGTSVVTDGVANVPLASSSALGAIKIDNSTIQLNSDNQVVAKSLDGLTSTITELNYTDGVTSNIQTQLNAKGVTSVSFVDWS